MSKTKIKNAVNKKDNLKQRFAEMITFREMFGKMILEEKSDFGKLLLQQNWVSNEIIALLIDIDFYHMFLLKNNHIINILDNRNDLEKHTLGGLIKILKLFISERRHSGIINNLKKYNEYRNKLTHKISYGKYKRTDDLFSDANKAVLVGNKALSGMLALRKYMEKKRKTKL